jgi:hypothetical protein
MVFKTTSTSRRVAAVSIFELLIAVAIAAMLLAQVCCLWFYSTRSFASQMAYVELDQNSQRALDILSRDIRQVKDLTFFSSNRVVFVDVNNLPLEYVYDGKTLVRIENNAGRKVLLTECQTLNFAMYQRTPMQGKYEYYPTDDINICKLLEVRWLCSRKLFPTAPSTTESVQAAKIVLRSNKIL